MRVHAAPTQPPLRTRDGIDSRRERCSCSNPAARQADAVQVLEKSMLKALAMRAAVAVVGVYLLL